MVQEEPAFWQKVISAEVHALLAGRGGPRVVLVVVLVVVVVVVVVVVIELEVELTGNGGIGQLLSVMQY